jgi:hypothetical protein
MQQSTVTDSPVETDNRYGPTAISPVKTGHRFTSNRHKPVTVLPATGINRSPFYWQPA